jgi:hypothetical protein
MTISFVGTKRLQRCEAIEPGKKWKEGEGEVAARDSCSEEIFV